MKYPFLDLATVNSRYLQSLKEASERVIDSGRFIGGPEVEAFEKELAEICQAPCAVAVSNGLDALRLILLAWREMGLLAAGDGVIVAGNTYIASILAIVQAGLQPITVDPSPETFNITAKAIDDAVRSNPNARAVMPVHLFGRVAWDAEIAATVKRHNLLVIEDTAQAIGAISSADGLFGSRRAAALGHAGAFSFYPTKNIGALGDAGAVVTHSHELAETVRALANYGAPRRYHNIYVGLNCRMDPIQAAMLRAKLPDLDGTNARRFERAVAYNNVIDHPLVIKPCISPWVNDCVWHQYVIRVTGGQRDAMQRYLAENGVGTDIHYAVPPHMQPCFATLRHQPLPVTEQLADEILSLPISDCTSVADAAAIARIINNFPK